MCHKASSRLVYLLPSPSTSTVSSILSDISQQYTQLQRAGVAAERIFQILEMPVDIVDKPGAEQVLARYESEQKRYEKESKEVEDEAKKMDQETRYIEAQALRFDLGEGMLEIGVVMASLYFISRKKLFPIVSLIFGVSGIAVAISGTLL